MSETARSGPSTVKPAFDNTDTHWGIIYLTTIRSDSRSGGQNTSVGGRWTRTPPARPGRRPTTRVPRTRPRRSRTAPPPRSRDGARRGAPSIVHGSCSCACHAGLDAMYPFRTTQGRTAATKLIDGPCSLRRSALEAREGQSRHERVVLGADRQRVVHEEEETKACANCDRNRQATGADAAAGLPLAQHRVGQGERTNGGDEGGVRPECAAQRHGPELSAAAGTRNRAHGRAGDIMAPCVAGELDDWLDFLRCRDLRVPEGMPVRETTVERPASVPLDRRRRSRSAARSARGTPNCRTRPTPATKFPAPPADKAGSP